MKRIFSGILAVLMVVVDLVFYNILPMPGVRERSIDSGDDPIYLTAHRGVNAKAPENTIPAYQLAIDMGYYAVETDVRQTKDGVWVISHNDNIGKWYNGKVNISETTYEDLLQYKVKQGHGLRKYGTLRIPTLEAYLDLFVGTEARPQIEIKDPKMDGIPALLDMVAAKGLAKQAMIISFDLEQLRFIREQSPDIELWYLCNEITDTVIDEAKSLGGNVWISCNFQKNTVETMQASIDAGIPVSIWTVDSVKDAKTLYDAGFRYMETDRLCP